MNTWIYIFDEFKLIDVDTGKLFRLAEENPLRLFEIIKEVLVDDIKEIRDVKVYDIYFNPSNFELLIEYIVECELGEISVKIIHSRIPKQTLRNYYIYEKQVKESK